MQNPKLARHWAECVSNSSASYIQIATQFERASQYCSAKRKHQAKPDAFFLVEHRGFEPLTPTLPVLCAPNCANAPNNMYGGDGEARTLDLTDVNRAL